MHLGRRKRPQRQRAAAHSTADDERARLVPSDPEPSADVRAIQAFAGHPQWKTPGENDLAPVGVAAEREVERAIADGFDPVRRMHQDDPRAYGTVDREIGPRVTARGVVQ